MNQSDLYLMMTVTGRDRLPDFITLYKDKGVDVHLISLGHGTANLQLLKYLALNETEKAICFTIVTGRKWLELKHAMSVRLRIEAPGVGIAYVIPLASIGGKRELMFLTDGQGYQKGEEKILKGTEQELLIVIGAQGYSEMIMDAARAAGARGGTVIHARGTGMQKAEQFRGIALGSEKEVILIVTAAENKKEMMQNIIREAGPGTKAGSIVFSIPVEDTAGMTL
ncbi:MAG: P-II family nitrogen regulator, partial [Clostridia bacterium]|nr:P-II family nitrogen regulator [Clostridia bacterium]